MCDGIVAFYKSLPFWPIGKACKLSIESRLQSTKTSRPIHQP